jgi:predicted nucleic-acid-binding protein
MIAVDTNVLLWYLLDDDAGQSKKASAIIAGNTNILITDIVLTETIWTLKGKKYNLEKESIIKVINTLFAEPNIIFEDGQTIWRALNDYKQAKTIKVGNKRKEADFPDALIINKALYVANTLNESLDGVYTFDLALQTLPGTRKP